MRGGNGRFRADDLPVGLNGVDGVKDRRIANQTLLGGDGASAEYIVRRQCLFWFAMVRYAGV